MKSMFGISPERARYKNDGCSPSLMNRMEDILRPFRAYVSWLGHSIGLHPIFMYYTPSGRCVINPEGVACINDGYSPSKNRKKIKPYVLYPFGALCD
jgi:hypothetical protein